MTKEFLSLEEVLRELQIDESELEVLVLQGQIRAVGEGKSRAFRHDDVVRVKKGRESNPTITLPAFEDLFGMDPEGPPPPPPP